MMVLGNIDTAMRNKIYIGLAALMAGLLSTACADRLEPTYLNGNTNTEETAVEKTMVFQATLEQNEAETKTSLSGLNVVWTAGDQILVFNAATPAGAVFTLSSGPGTPNGSFTGEDIGDGPYYAIYPASAAAAVTPFTTDPLEIKATIPMSQTYVAGSFGNGANIAIAKSDGETTNLSFKNVLGVVSFTLKGTATIKEVNLYTRGSEVLNGAVTIGNLDGDPTAALTDTPAESNQRISLSCGEGVPLNDGAGVTFYVAVPAVTLSSGFFVEFIDNASTAMIKGSGNVTINRSNIRKMPAFSYGAQFGERFLKDFERDVNGDYTFAAYSAVKSSACDSLRAYKVGKAQSAFTNTTGEPGSRSVRFQDWKVGYAISLDIAQYNLPINSTPNVAVRALGNTNGVTSKAYKEMKVVKRTANHAWIVDNDDATGYVVLLQ